MSLTGSGDTVARPRVNLSARRGGTSPREQRYWRPIGACRRLLELGRAVTLLTILVLSEGAAFQPTYAQDATTSADDQNARAFPTGYAVQDDAIWTFFSRHGGESVLGDPLSREILLLGNRVQIFQNAVLQIEPDGSVRAMQLTDPGLLPYSQIGGLSFPAVDPAIEAEAPSPNQPNYVASVPEFVRGVAPDSFAGVPVEFFTTWSTTVPCAAAFPDQACDPSTLLGLDLDIWGLPTSSPAADPANPNFVLERFQNTVMLHDATAGTTYGLPFGQYLAELLTGVNLPGDLHAEAAGSPLLSAYAPGQPLALAHPSLLTNTDLTSAFVPDAAGDQGS